LVDYSFHQRKQVVNKDQNLKQLSLAIADSSIATTQQEPAEIRFVVVKNALAKTEHDAM